MSGSRLAAPKLRAKAGSSPLQTRNRSGERPVFPGLCRGAFIATFIVVPSGNVQGSGGGSIKVASKFATKVWMVVRMGSEMTPCRRPALQCRPVRARVPALLRPARTRKILRIRIHAEIGTGSMRDANREPVPLSHPTRKAQPSPNARSTDKGLDARSERRPPARRTFQRTFATPSERRPPARRTFLTQLKVPSVCAPKLINLKAAEHQVDGKWTFEPGVGLA